MLYQVKYPNLWFMYSWHFMTIFQYYGLNIFFLSNWSANLAIFQCHREEDGGNVAKLFGAELDAEPGVRNGGYPMRQQWGFRGGKELKSMIYLIFRWSWVFIFGFPIYPMIMEHWKNIIYFHEVFVHCHAWKNQRVVAEIWCDYELWQFFLGVLICSNHQMYGDNFQRLWLVDDDYDCRVI